MARVLGADGVEAEVPATQLKVGDRVVVEAGDVIPGDGDIVEGIASVDESAITGESAPVIREAGGDRSAVTGGTRVLSDRIVVRITAAAGDTFLDKMIALVEGTSRRKTPNEIALSILLASLTLVFLAAVATLAPMADYAGAPQDVVVLVALLVCLIPTTIGALLSAIGIAGMDRLVRVNVLAMSGRAVEAAGDVSTLLLDKTGTITYGNRQASRFLPAPGVDADELRDVVRLSSLADQTPEGRSVVDLALAQGADDHDLPAGASFVEFTAQTRMSGVDLSDGTEIRKGAGSAIAAWLGVAQPVEVRDVVEEISREGGTPLVIGRKDASGTGRVLGVIHLKDVVKEGMVERFAELRAMGIRTVMITGDNALTAQAIATEAGVDDFLAEATPEDKMAYIRKEQEGGRLVAMTGDGTNDAPALAAADVGVAMNSGTAAAKEAGNMVDLDSDPTKLIDIVEIGKQLLITRGALTTFSIANDVAKYFAIIPAMFVAAYPSLDRLNVMGLASPESAILSAVIFNALVIVALIPLALRGVRFRAASATAVLRRNILVFGLGGIVVPFVGIKLIDLLVSTIPGLGS
jgi:K+-transporting ATPase ATPase B chain